jgi:predicted tellurium resistance membrane protein TerC
MELLLSPDAWLAFLTLTALEIVLGIDNLIFIAILVERLPRHQRFRGRTLGLGMALLTRLLLLFSLTWLMALTKPLFEVLGQAFSGRDLVLLAGGLFLLVKATGEIHTSLEGELEVKSTSGGATMRSVILQIAVIDIVFSLDSVITAVGLVKEIEIMVAAIVVAMVVMVFAAGPISHFIERHPTFKMLALAFLILIGVVLVAEGFGFHVPRGYIYFSLVFSFAVEALNTRFRTRRQTTVARVMPSSPQPVEVVGKQAGEGDL